MKKTTLELGGKSANIILDDVILEDVVPLGVRACMNNSGQFCGAWTRMLVPRTRTAEVYELAATAAQELRVGDPRDEATQLGPVIDRKQYQTILGYINAGIGASAALLCGGLDRPPGYSRGYYIQPTVFGDVDNSMTIAREEIFGPVLSIIPYHDDDDAVRIANDSDYGLRGAVFSADHDRALAIARRLRTGQVDINGYKMNPDSPFGGYKRSGHGRSQGLSGLLEFLQVKSIQV